MHYTVDVDLISDDNRSIEWVLFIFATNFSEVVQVVERKVSERWPNGVVIRELNLQIVVTPDQWTLNKTRSFDAAAVYSESEPREMIRRKVSPARRLWASLFGSQRS